MSNLDKLLILDGNSVLHRAYYALPDWRNRRGEATAGVYGFLSILLKSIDGLKPTHLVIVFDHPGPTFRHLMYVGYQTNREKDRQIFEDIYGQIDKLKVIFEKAGTPVFQVEGFEADDIIGTIAVQATTKYLTPDPSPNLGEGNERGEVIIITGDRDLMQLVNDNVNLYMSFKGISDMTIVDSDKVKERLGILPSQVIDYKALVGDTSDNYPGVPGIGPKGAIDLISNYSNFENIYKNLDKIKESTKQRLVNGYESGELSKRLATIKCDVPITFDNARCQVPSAKKLSETLEELGYKSLTKRVEKPKQQESLF